MSHDLDRFGVPPLLARPVAERMIFRRTRALTAARAWIHDGQATILVLAGSVGTGKSQAAAWALDAHWQITAAAPPGSPLRRRGARGVNGLPLWLSASALNAVAPWDEAVARWKGAEILVIDDLGTEEATPKALSLVDSTIVHRCAEGLHTVITTNLAQSAFAKRYGERFTDRVRQSGLDDDGRARWWVRCVSESLRGRHEPEPAPASEIEPPSENMVTIERIESVATMFEGFVEEKRIRDKDPSDAERARHLRRQMEEIRAAQGE